MRFEVLKSRIFVPLVDKKTKKIEKQHLSNKSIISRKKIENIFVSLKCNLNTSL